MQEQRAIKGIFITTSDFTREAVDFVSRIDSRIILVNGTLLAEWMIDLGVGVTRVATYTLQKIDLDYFLKD